MSSDQGERGDQGQRGISGERGPKGDHGQQGDTGQQGERGKSFLNFSKLQLLAFLVVAAFAAYGNFQAYQLADDNKTALDGIAQNRDLNCRAAEAKHAKEIEDLKGSYAILKDPPAVYRELIDNPIVLADFRETILAAANDEDVAGEYVSPVCDEPGVGLPEPDPANLAVPTYVEELLPGITGQVARAEHSGVAVEGKKNTEVTTP